MRLYAIVTLLLFLVIFSLPHNVLAEGSNEVWVDKANAETKLHLCNDFVNFCNSGGDRRQFAVYNCAPRDRLFFEVASTTERVYIGLNSDDWQNQTTSFCVYQIRRWDGTIVQPEMVITELAGDVGHIDDIGQAREGPQQLGAPGGYNAHIFYPPDSGRYYIEFDREDENGNQIVNDWQIYLFDVTIADSVTNVVETGRLHSQAWQYYDGYDGWPVNEWKKNSSTFYVYSSDSIITSVEFEDLEGRAWIMFCNDRGCQNTGDFEEDRKSLDGQQAYVPQYRIFLNEPDSNLFPPASTTGQIIPPITMDTYCDSGVVIFNVEVDKAANVEILLDFEDPYVDRTLPSAVVVGVNQIVWDGLDGAGMPVANNANVTFSVSYINGLTHLPLYDIELNVNGFRILLISPVGPTPLVYWDDSNILDGGGNVIGTTNFTGCLSVPPEPGCHSWDQIAYGDYNTINTWWYSASETTLPLTIQQKRSADTLVFDQMLPQIYCAGVDSLYFSVALDPNTEAYHWNYTGIGATIIQGDSSENFINVIMAPDATSGDIQVWGTNENCPVPGPITSLAITIDPIPVPEISVIPNDTVCINDTVMFFGIDTVGLNIVSWYWDFGDGGFATTQNTSHVYTSTLTDTVKLIVISDAGCTDTAEMLIWVVDPTIDFSKTPPETCVFDTVFFSGIGDVTFTEWYWDFGDGNDTIGKNVYHIYTTYDTFDVTLDVCSKQVVHQHVVHPAPLANAGSDETICERSSHDFSNSTIIPSADTYDSIRWYGGTGTFNDPTLLLPVYIPAAGELGNVTLSMIAYAKATCEDDTSSMVLYIIESPLVDFTYTPSDSICVSELIQFFGTSSTNINTWAWDFGDSNTSPLQNPTHFYDAQGFYDVTLIVVNDSLCSDTISYQLQVNRLPQATIEVLPDTAICALEEVVFNGSSTPPNIIEWEWDFGDGTADTGQNVTHIYPTPGSYNVRLNVLNVNSCVDTVYQQIVIDTLPVAFFTMNPPDTACTDETVIFTGSGSSNIQLWRWDFGDSSPPGNGQVVAHEYSAPGLYTIMLVAISFDDCRDTVWHNLEVVDVTIGFSMTPYDPTCEDFTVDFTGSGNASFTDWIWDLGDGTIDTGKFISHIYPNPGTYPISLTVCSQLALDTLIVYPQAVNDAGSNEEVCEREPFNLLGSVVTPTASNYDSIMWYGGTGTFNDPNTVVPIYTPGPGEIGPVVLTMVAYGIVPCYNDTSSMTLIVIDAPEPVITFVPADSICVSEPIQFLGNSTTNIITWDWDFGDGNTSALQNPTHFYGASGSYNIMLIAYNDAGCEDTAFTQLTIYVLPEPDISVLPDSVICAEEELTFNGSSTTNIVSWFWDFDDGTTALVQNTTYTYPNPGTYNVMLIVENDNSCRDTAFQQIIIDALPSITDFTASPNDTSCVGEQVSFDGTGSADINTWEWNFGDGSPLVYGQNVTYTFTTDGNYDVTLVVFNVNGCMDTLIHQQVVIDLSIDFSMNPDPSCQNFPVTFTGTSNENADFTDWLWDFGDGNTGFGQVVTHTYTTANTYIITLDVCSESATYQLIVNPEAYADAGSDTATCEDVWFDLSTKTVPPSASNYSSIFWYGGTGTFDDPTAIAPIYTPGPTELGFVTLYMVAYGISPCYNDTSTMVLEVIEGAYAQAGSDEHSCVDVPYDFTNSSFQPFATNYISLQWSGGAGSFVNPNVEVPVYIPGPGELGPVTLTVLALGVLNCDSIDEMILTIHPDYLVPFDTTICYLDSVFAQGAWQGASGTFYDTLLSVWGCDSVIQTNLTVRPEIDRDFTISPNDSTCIGEAVFFTQTGSANIVNWLWDFGDGATSSAQDPNHSYPTPGPYTVTLTYTDDNGCSDFKEHDVFVFEHPDVDFITSQTSACINAQFSFMGLSNDNIISWDWDLGDGTTANTQNVSHIYTTYGLFQVTLTVTADNGCMNSITKPMVVAQPPTADFEYYVVQCDTIQFTDLSTSPPGYNLVQWQWDLGDGSTSNLQNPWHVYDTNGVVFVTLIVSADSSGNICNDTIIKPITVPARPTVYFTWDPEPTCVGSQTSFFGTSGNSIAGWYWDFGDGNFATVQEPTHMYTSSGTYNVILSVTDMNGCTDTTMHTVTVNDIPDVDFTVNPNPACQDNQTSFTGISSGTITIWSWNFGDGGVGTGQNTTHTYSQAGTYTVILTIRDTTGCTNMISYPVSVSPPPTANFTSSSPACSADSIFFLNYSTTPNGYIQEWEWDFGDGTIVTIQYPNDPDIAHLYSGGGTFTVTLTILDSDSCTHFFSQDVVIEASPIADFNNTPGCQGEAVEFTDLSSPNSGSTIVSWFWEFDDPASGSNTSTQQHPTHLFSGNGTYDVILVIHNVAGCADTLVKAVDVNELPAVDFTMSTDTVCINEEITFTSLAPTASNYLWDFGDGGTSVLRDPVYVYTTDGVFTVTLTVSDGNGCENSISHDVVVDPLPWAAYSSSAPACTSTPVYFTDLSSAVSGFLTEWHWYFGDGTDTIVYYPDDPDVHHNYANAGDYTAILAVTSSAGCVDSMSQDLTILQGPEALFGYAGSNCQGSTMQFNDMSNGFGSTIGSWQWNFGDPSSGANNTSNLQNPTHVFDTSGTYTVMLQVTITEGCYDVVTQDITIAPPPPVYYYTDPPSSCFTDVTYFYTDPDSTNLAEVASYLWDFDDPASGANNLSTLQDPTHVFTTPGTYSVTLTITDINGCENMITRQVSVTNKPTADYSYELPCVADSTQFTDLSISGGASVVSWFWDFDDPTTAPNDTSNLQNPRHMFSGMGTYTVMLIAMDINGCMDTSYKTIDVSDSPGSAFMFQQACDPPGTMFFTDSSFMGTGGQPIVAWKWELEPGYFSYEVNPQYTYNYTDSCYQVNLTVTDEHGCENTSTREVCVSDPLSVAFTGNDVCMGERTYFSSSYLPGTDSILQWSWDFGDGSAVHHTANDTISHTYGQAGTYLVIVTGVNTDNCESSTFTEISVNALPEPDFAASAAKCDEPTVFTDLSASPGTVITSWQWDFGDGTYSTVQNPQHTYGPEDSTYTVTLTLTNAAGCVDSIQREVTKGVCVQALFDLTSQTVCNEHDVCFADYSYVYADEYPLTRWQWDFGDGTIETYTNYQDSICHVYANNGIYQVSLTVTALVHGVDNQDSTSRQVQIATSPTSDFASSKPCINSGTLFTDLTQGHGSVITSWSWNFGDINATVDTSTQQNPTYSYANPGTYTIELITRNNYGCSDTLRDELEIFALPEVDFSFNLPCAGKVTHFMDETIAGQAAFNQWSWNFGDSQSTTDTSNQQNPGYIYGQEGNYTVALRVTDDNTCEDVTNKVIEVYPTPESEFNTVSNYGGIQGQVLCENLTSGAILYAWDFGNGLTSELESPVTVYEQDGTYIIQLISTNEYQCADTSYQEYDLILQGLYVPNAFVPEGDNLDLQTFRPVGSGLRSYLLEIFDKWGTLLWSSSKLDKQGSPTEGWDGTYKGSILPVGDYVWSINAQFESGHRWQGSDVGDGNSRTYGTVALIR